MGSKYEEALERCKKEFDFNNLAYSHEEIKQRLERVFPELCESEDDRIRKAISYAIANSAHEDGTLTNGVTEHEALSWLERSEQTIIIDVLIKAGLKPYKDGDKWCVLVGDNIQDGVCGFGDTIDEALFEFLKELAEKQSEQKPTGNVKPKFKVGDWVVWYDKISCHVDNIYQAKNSLMYTVTDTNNTTSSYSVIGFDKNAHLWTIQDAKYGDMLFTSSTASHEIFIFKGLDKNGNVECICSYDSEDGFLEGKYHFIGKPSFNTLPATKEERETLFKAMCKAGYEWDADKKELKKIEQKPAGEPKFKVGDWVMLDRPVIITKVEDMPYNTHQYWTSDGKWFGDATKAKLWTIQDAKDGDVLVTESGRPFIFKGCLDEKHPNSPVSYCGIDSTNYFYNYKGSAWWTDENVYPATKEQRDLLFQKMHEAGYEWDAENKKLITIEQNHIRPVCYNNMDDLIADAMIDEINQSNLPESSKHNRIFWIKSHRQKRDWNGEDSCHYDDICEILINLIHSPKSNVNKDVVEKDLIWIMSIRDRIKSQAKPTWSAEDEQNLEGIITEIETNKNDAPDYDLATYDRFLSWLKSIKDRVQPQPKQEWSEEDEARFKNLCSIIDDSEWNKASKDGFKNWLKSLKPNHWKPTKEQMDALDKAKNSPANYYDINLGLQSLYNDLSKL